MPIALQTAITGQTDYAVRMTLENSTTQVAGSPFALAELLPGLYRANPAQTDVFADGLYRIEFIKGGAPLSPPVYDTYQLRGGQEAALATAFSTGDRTTLEAISTRASEARLINLETVARDATAATYRATGFSTPAQVTAVTTAVNNARDNVNTNTNTARDAVIAAPAFTAGDRTTLNAISTRASEVRLANLETVARDSTAATYRATGFSTPANVNAVTTAVNAARDAVLNQGNTEWSPDNLTISRLGGLLTGDYSRFTATALSNAPTGGGGSAGLTTEQNARLFAIPVDPLLAGSYVAPDNDAIADLAQSVAQIPTTAPPAPSAIATAVQEALEPQLDAIAGDTTKARAGKTNKAIANPITGITTVFADDGTTPLYRILTRNANGEPALEDTVVREVVPLT
jgi:hypothetical protein